MRALLAALLLAPCLALAEDAPAVAGSPEVTAAPTPALDAVRLFNTTEVSELAPSDVRVELRYAYGAPGTVPRMEVRAEVGFTSHLQLSLAEDLNEAAGQPILASATPIALRYALGAHDGDVPGNPAVEVEVIPRPNAPARAGVRLMVAEELVPRLVVAANGYLEQNLDRGTPTGVDGALGVTAGASYSLFHDHLHLGAEGQVGAAQYGLPPYALVLAAGPNAVLSAGPFAGTLSPLFDLTQRRIGFEPMATVGGTF